MKVIRNSFIYSLVLLLLTFGTYGQFPSTESYKLCTEIPKAKKVGDTVYVHTCMAAGKGYILKRINSKGKYIYKALLTYKSKISVTYDENNKVKSYKYRFNSGLWGGSGKGFFVIHYYDNGNIKDYGHVQYYKSGELCVYSPLDYKEDVLSKIPKKCYFLYKRRNKVFISNKLLFDNKELNVELKHSTLERADELILDIPYELYYLKPKGG